MAQNQRETPEEWGITDVLSGLGIGRRLVLRMRHDVVRATTATPSELTSTAMTLLSLFSRIEAFHKSALDAIEAGNPYATFTLLRAYAENAAVLAWILQAPGRLDILRVGSQQHPPKMGKVIAAARLRFGAFDEIYEQLSAYAHPVSSSLLTSWKNTDDGDPGNVEWRSDPRWVSEREAVVACFWLAELAEANTHLWVEAWAHFMTNPSDTEVLIRGESS